MPIGCGTYFNRSVNVVERATALWHIKPVVTRPGSRSAAQAAGLRYEAKVLEHFEETLPTFLAHLPFSFIADNTSGRIIPDGIISGSSNTRLCIVEIKLRHDTTGYFQLQFYRKIVQKAFPQAQIKLLEVTKNYDPSVQLPVTPIFVPDDIMDWIENGSAEYGVHIWTGR